MTNRSRKLHLLWPLPNGENSKEVVVKISAYEHTSISSNDSSGSPITLRFLERDSPKHSFYVQGFTSDSDVSSLKTQDITQMVEDTELQECFTTISTIENTMGLLMILQVEIFATAVQEIFRLNTTFFETVVTCCHA